MRRRDGAVHVRVEFYIALLARVFGDHGVWLAHRDRRKDLALVSMDKKKRNRNNSFIMDEFPDLSVNARSCCPLEYMCSA